MESGVEDSIDLAATPKIYTLPQDILRVIWLHLKNNPTLRSFALTSKPLLSFYESRFTKGELVHPFSKRTFCSTCAQFGYFELAQWGYSQSCPVVDAISPTLVSNAPESRALPFMKWARSKGAKFFKDECKQASKAGYLETVKWLAEEGKWRETDLWRQEVVVGAAEGGHMDILLWAKAQGYLSLSYSAREGTCLTRAGVAGGIEILQWLISENFIEISGKTDPLVECTGNAVALRTQVEAREKNFEMMKYLLSHGAAWSFLAAKYLLRSGDLEIVKWAQEHGCPQHEAMCANAARSGNLEMLKWALGNGGTLGRLTCSHAAGTGNLEMLKWARDRGCQLNEGLTCYIASAGNLKMLKWAHDQGCSWSRATCAIAAKSGHFEILKWAREHGCPWHENTCILATERNNVEILDWAFKNGCPCDAKNIYQHAIHSGSVDVLNWAKENVPLDPTDHRQFLSTHGSHKAPAHVIPWLQKNGMLFPEDFPAISNVTSAVPLLLWMLTETLPPELRGEWREVEVVLERLRPGNPKVREVVVAAKEVLRGILKVEEFCHLVLEWGGR